jgi:hypothetical protein
MMSGYLALPTLLLSGRQGAWVANQGAGGGLSTRRACSKWGVAVKNNSSH